MTSHYAVIAFSGDPAGEHPDEELRGQPPRLNLIACGPENFCWDVLARRTATRPLRMWEEAEVLGRDPVRVADQAARTRARLANDREAHDNDSAR